MWVSGIISLKESFCVDGKALMEQGYVRVFSIEGESMFDFYEHTLNARK